MKRDSEMKYKLDLKRKRLINNILLLMLISACSGGGGGGGGGGGEVLSSLTKGYSVPQGISVIPAENSEQLNKSIQKRQRVLSALHLSKKSLQKAETDFEKTGNLELKVDEPALDEFSEIERILKIFKQTNYWEERVVNKGPYKALVKYEYDNNEFEFETWTIDSKMIVLDGKDVNRVRFWIPGSEDGGETRGKLDIFSPPTDANKYGEWRLDVTGEGNGDDDEGGYFSAESKLQSNGSIKLSMSGDENGSSVLYLKNDTGKGLVQYRDVDNCFEEYSKDCDLLEAKMAYNDTYALIQKGDEEEKCKDRSEYADIYMDYVIFDENGANINKVKTYNFPLIYNDKYYYYSGWRGRNQLWGEDSSNLKVNTILKHGDHDNKSTYKIKQRIKGILTKKSGITLCDSNCEDAPELSELGDDALEFSSWQDSKSFYLVYIEDEWKYCSYIDWDTKTCSDWGTLTSLSEGAGFTNTDEIFSGHGSDNKRVTVYEVDNYIWTDLISESDNAAAFSSQLDDSKAYYVSVQKNYFIKYVDGWKSCIADYSENVWNPDLTCTSPFSWDEIAMDWGAMSINFWTRSGTQYIALIDDSTNAVWEGDETGTGDLLKLVKLKEEVVNAAVTGNLQQLDYDGNAIATYTFGSNRQLKDVSDDLVDESKYELYDSSGNEYYWNYSEYGDWDVVTYLSYESNPPSGKTKGQFVEFDEPLIFSAVEALRYNGDEVTLKNLIYDGWLQGLPDVWSMLYENRQDNADAGLSPEQKNKIINIPDGTTMTDSEDNTYKIRPLYGLRILDEVDAGVCAGEVAIDESISVSDSIKYEEHGLGSQPEVDEVIVMEGKFIN
jgi:hypothetical protein